MYMSSLEEWKPNLYIYIHIFYIQHFKDWMPLSGLSAVLRGNETPRESPVIATNGVFLEYHIAFVTWELWSENSLGPVHTNMVSGHASSPIRYNLIQCSLVVNKMNPGYFSLAATVLKTQQIPMFLHTSARIWGHRWYAQTSAQWHFVLNPQ